MKKQHVIKFPSMFIFKGIYNPRHHKQSYCISNDQEHAFPVHQSEAMSFSINVKGMSLDWKHEHRVAPSDLKSVENMIAYMYRNLAEVGHLRGGILTGLLSRRSLHLENVNAHPAINRDQYDDCVLYAISEAWEVKPSQIFISYERERPGYKQHRFLADPAFAT